MPKKARAGCLRFSQTEALDKRCRQGYPRKITLLEESQAYIYSVTSWQRGIGSRQWLLRTTVGSKRPELGLGGTLPLPAKMQKEAAKAAR